MLCLQQADVLWVQQQAAAAAVGKLGKTSSLSTTNQSTYDYIAGDAHLTCTEMVCRSWSSHRSGSHTALLPDRAASNLQHALQPSTNASFLDAADRQVLHVTHGCR